MADRGELIKAAMEALAFRAEMEQAGSTRAQLDAADAATAALLALAESLLGGDLAEFAGILGQLEVLASRERSDGMGKGEDSALGFPAGGRAQDAAERGSEVLWQVPRDEAEPDGRSLPPGVEGWEVKGRDRGK